MFRSVSLTAQQPIPQTYPVKLFYHQFLTAAWYTVVSATLCVVFHWNICNFIVLSAMHIFITIL